STSTWNVIVAVPPGAMVPTGAPVLLIACPATYGIVPPTSGTGAALRVVLFNTYLLFAGMISLKFTPVAGPEPPFTTLIVYATRSPGEPPAGAVSTTIAADLVD